VAQIWIGADTQNLSVSNAAAGGTTVAGGNQIGLATGIRHSF